MTWLIWPLLSGGEMDFLAEPASLPPFLRLTSTTATIIIMITITTAPATQPTIIHLKSSFSIFSDSAKQQISVFTGYYEAHQWGLPYIREEFRFLNLIISFIKIFLTIGYGNGEIFEILAFNVNFYNSHFFICVIYFKTVTKCHKITLPTHCLMLSTLETLAPPHKPLPCSNWTMMLVVRTLCLSLLDGTHHHKLFRMFFHHYCPAKNIKYVPTKQL